jgi:transcriptional regulator with XRE-family HTH domain
MKIQQTESSNVIGKTIKLARQERGWKQSDMAAKLGISIAAFSKIETGHTTVNLKRLGDIAGLLNVNTNYLLTSEQQKVEQSREEQTKLLKAEILLKEEEISKLQQTAISLYEELKAKRKKQPVAVN